jgi:hypothetical protein
MIKGRDVVRMTRENDMSSRDKTSIINGRSKGVDGRSNRERSSQGRRKVFQFPVNGASNQFLLGFLSVVMMNCSKPEFMKSIELLSTISKTRKIRCDVPMVDAQYFLQFRRKGIMVLADEIQTPEGHIRGEQKGEVGIFIEEFIRGKIGPMTRGRIVKRHENFFNVCTVA